jgi:hypothetical protein
MWHGMLNQATSGQLPISAKIALFTDGSAAGITAIWGLWCMTSRFTPAYANEHFCWKNQTLFASKIEQPIRRQ